MGRTVFYLYLTLRAAWCLGVLSGGKRGVCALLVPSPAPVCVPASWHADPGRLRRAAACCFVSRRGDGSFVGAKQMGGSMFVKGSMQERSSCPR